jgi:hypothetical protein
MPWVFCGRWEHHPAHGHTCPGTGKCGHGKTHDAHLVLEGTLQPYWCFGSRIRLYREGKVTNDGRKLLNTTWRAEPLPVMMMNQTRDDQSGHDWVTVVGKLTEVRKEPSTGWVTGLLTLDKPRNVSGMAAEADFVSYEPSKIPGKTDTDDVLVMTNAKLHGVTLGEHPTWDGMEIP